MAKKRVKKEELMEVSQVAQVMQVSRSTVYNMIRAGKLRAMKYGVVKGFRVLAGDVERLMEREA